MAAHVFTQNKEHNQDDPLEESSPSSTTATSHFDPNLVQALAQEMMKFMKGKQVEQEPNHLRSYAYFTGIITSTSPNSISSHFDTCCAMQINYGGC